MIDLGISLLRIDLFVYLYLILLHELVPVADNVANNILLLVFVEVCNSDAEMH